jgi:magnesium transporter
LAGGGPVLAMVNDDVVEREGAADEVAASTGAPTQIGITVFDEGSDPCEAGLDELARLVQQDRLFVWVDLSDYEPADLRCVAEILDLNRVAVHVALSAWQRPRLDSFKTHYFVAATVARIDAQEYRIQAGQLDLFVGNNFLVSTHKLPLPFSASIMERSRHNPELLELDSSYMLYIILDELLAYSEQLSEAVRGEVEQLEENALSDANDQFLQQLLQIKRYVYALDSLLEQHRQVFEAFLRPDFTFVSGNEVDVYFRDLDDRLKRLLDELRVTRDSVNGAFDIYVSFMAHRTNNIIRVLTVVSTIILPITLVVSFFGTSFQGLPIYGANAFVVMLLLVVVLVGGILAIFRSQRWI